MRCLLPVRYLEHRNVGFFKLLFIEHFQYYHVLNIYARYVMWLDSPSRNRGCEVDRRAFSVSGAEQLDTQMQEI